jgi:hypothetical protein
MKSYKHPQQSQVMFSSRTCPVHCPVDFETLKLVPNKNQSSGASMQRVTPHGSRTLAPKNAIKEKWFRIIIIQILQVNDAASSVRVLNKNGCVRSSRGQSKYNHC